ncbi:hypothetical protein AGLY_008676 [Aphis glycines]|uniref:CCHC-type domain-containing protein n=1 Tax=Aphis glycines TaxID=307491 RepID=A0A6G0TKD6_APHGL|nr:hypothetical protein AGLY_008676 [Aphis glycines]
MNKSKGTMPNTNTLTNKFPNSKSSNALSISTSSSPLKQTTNTFDSSIIRNHGRGGYKSLYSLHAQYHQQLAATSQTSLAHTSNTTEINNTVNNINFTYAAATDKTPIRDHAIVFNSIDGVPQIQYILAIGKIVQPNNIKFVSRISNNRFCIFLSNKQILDNLMQTTSHINIHDHVIQIRRLINPAKRFIISNVCPSIPNQAIVDALKNSNIVPISQITHLKAGIKVEGYEHIMSFRRQIYINYDDVPKLPSSLLINVNDNQFRIFFTDDKITCFLCKSVGHTTTNCNKNTEDKFKSDHSSVSNATNTLDITTEAQIEDTLPPSIPDSEFLEKITMDWSNEPEPSSLSNITPDVSHDSPPNETYKRPFSESSSSKPPSLPNHLNPPTTILTKENAKKKPKIRSRSNSSNRQENAYEERLKTVEEFFTTNDSSPITFLQFRYILDNFTLKSMNIHTLTKNANTDLISLMDLIDSIREIVKERKLKLRLSKLAQLLFQALPPQDSPA